MEVPHHPHQGKLIQMTGGDENKLRNLLIEVINENKGSKNRAAQVLGVRHSAINRWCDKLGIVIESVARENKEGVA